MNKKYISEIKFCVDIFRINQFKYVLIKIALDKKELDKLVEQTYRNILVGTNEEFNDGPPCLALCSKTKLDHTNINGGVLNSLNNSLK